MTVIYKGQRLEYIKDFHGREVLWIMDPSQIQMPGMTYAHDSSYTKSDGSKTFESEVYTLSID